MQWKIPRQSKQMTRSFNFSAGPAALPLEVLEEAAAELFDYRGTGMSVMEMSHRSAEFIDIAQRAEADLRELLGVSNDYAVLFLQGGATAQFAALPLNLLGDRVAADHVETGAWAKKAISEAQRYCQRERRGDLESDEFRSHPAALGVATRSRSRLRAHRRQRDDRRR